MLTGLKTYPVNILSRYPTSSVFPRDASWRVYAPYVKKIWIKSTLDKKKQPSLFYNSDSSKKKPLLIVLHSWSHNYLQVQNIPYAYWCRKKDWVFLHPNFRGKNNHTQAACSKYALQDILDALRYAKNKANIDSSRIYLTGYSGGAMAALVLAGKYPQLWAGIVSWGPVFDLSSFYFYARYTRKRRKYAKSIVKICGGVPKKNSKAYKSAINRSPKSYLKYARNRNLPIYLATGIHDSFVPTSHILNAYNELSINNRIFQEDILYIRQLKKIPEPLQKKYYNANFSRANKPLLFLRQDKNVTVALFKGGHDVIYQHTLSWLSKQKRKRR